MKYPEPGKVKTRLASSIGNENAAIIYNKLVYHTLGIASDFKQENPSVDIFIFFYPPEKQRLMLKKYPGPWEFLPQIGNHLGERMASAYHHVRGRRYRKVVIVGSDIGNIALSDLYRSFQALDEKNAVLGPAEDGGFYLIGFTSPHDRVLRFKSWGTPDVLRRTYDGFKDQGISVAVLRTRRDIDREEDLDVIGHEPWFHDTVSIIVPFLTERDRLVSLVSTLEPQLWPGDEIIVVKGGEAYNKAIENITPHTRLVFSRKGRGIQMNRGAAVSRGNLLWFLHVDSIPAHNFGYHIRKLSGETQNMLGCFKHAFQSDRFSLKLVSKWANLRTKRLNLPYGDQGLFCKKETFQKIGGFTKRFLMEDVEFVRACKREGRVLIIPYEIYSSPKRYLRKGILRASLENHFLMFLHTLSVDDRRLYRIYYRM